jgi:protein disulfide-isomerase A6
MKSAWVEAAEALKGKVKVGAVDCTAQQGVCSQYGIQGFPAVKFFGTSKKSPEDYMGPRDPESFTSFALERWALFLCFYHYPVCLLLHMDALSF